MLQRNISGMDNRAIYTSLKTGKRIYLRPIRPQDGLRIRESIANLSDQSRYYRFFSGMKNVPDSVLERLLAVDGVNHLAWGALDLATTCRPSGLCGSFAIRKPVSRNWLSPHWMPITIRAWPES